jgi:hypothetical protein
VGIELDRGGGWSIGRALVHYRLPTLAFARLWGSARIGDLRGICKIELAGINTVTLRYRSAV